MSTKEAGVAPLMDGKQRLTVFVDRTMLEVFASDGLTYVPLPFIPRKEDRTVSVQVKGGKARLTSLQVYKLKSIWERNTK
jgi:sucrose-6-phosphate hydrolase SacC (GH32 family)